MEWIKCTHKTGLPVGEYVVRYTRQPFNGFFLRVFVVSETQKHSEITEHGAFAYYKLPDFNF